MRTSAASSAAGSPITRASTSSDLSCDSKPTSLKIPKGVGSRVSATFITSIRPISISPAWQLSADDNIVGCATAAVRPIRNQAEGFRARDFVKERFSPSVLAYQFIHVAGIQDIRKTDDIAGIGQGTVHHSKLFHRGGQFFHGVGRCA